MDNAHSQTTVQVLKTLGTNPETGLTKKQVEEQTREYGKNELPSEPPTPLWSLILEQFKDELVVILLLAALISFVLAYFETDEKEQSTAYVEPIVILIILIANAVVGVVQESNAEKAIEALKEYSPDEAKVFRSGAFQKLHARDLVPGDIVSLASGDKVPADCRLFRVLSSTFRVDQAILTGESVSVTKESEVVIKDDNAVKQDMINMLFSGTTVTIGKALAIVTSTGSKTAIGDIHKSISSQIAEKTPLKKALDDFGDQLAKIISLICIAVWLINIRHFTDQEHFGGNWVKGAIYYFKIAVALAVAAIPEGLAVVITTCLALGTKKMAKQGAIVRKLRSVETLGCTSVICSDKTGTLTTNMMSVRRVCVMDNDVSFTDFTVTGSSYGPEGAVYEGIGYNHHGKKPISSDYLALNPVLNELSHICSICNESRVIYEDSNDVFHHLGEPTEAALKVLVEKLGTSDVEYNKKIKQVVTVDQLKKMSHREKNERNMAMNEYVEGLYRKLMTFEFSRERKSMSVLVERLDGAPVFGTEASSPTSGPKTRSRRGKNDTSNTTGSTVLYVKGAPETILERCAFVRLGSDPTNVAKMTDKTRKQIMKKVTEWGETEALRILAMATVDNPTISENDKVRPEEYETIESNMTFVGLCGMMDPPRPGVRTSIQKCHDAGIRVIVITGDNQNTAESICRQIGVFGDDEELDGKSFTGKEFVSMSKEEKRDAVVNASLFSRTEPGHKQELVELLREQGFIVAMTGDGVNDAPALKRSDIGIAMGSGTDVAKLASDMVLADDNFATIVSAVEEGRSIYSNTKQFIRYLISSNIGEVVSIFLTVLLGMPEALIPVQLLWVNLVTDGLPATALGFNPADHDIMHQPPRDSKEPIVTKWLFIRYCVIGTYVGIATVFGYAWWYMYYSGGPQITFEVLSNYHKCASMFGDVVDCSIFSGGYESKKAATISLSVLVVVEMFNAMNSLSENESLLTFFIHNNVYLCFAILLSMALHFMILYVPFFSTLFSIVPLDWEEWKWVLLISAPVLVVDEVLKFISRNYVLKRRAGLVGKAKKEQ